MDDKDLIKKTKNSLKAKKSRAEIMKGFQKRGYKLEYADALLKKAQKPKKIMLTFLFVIIVLIAASAFSYSFLSSNQKMDLSNPLSGFSITGNAISPGAQNSQQEITLAEIQITPDFISYLLNEIGAWKLTPNPLTFEKPIINFKIEDKTFHSIIGKEIITLEGSNNKADLQFDTNKKDIINAIQSDTPDVVFKESIVAGNTKIQMLTSEAELFSKGYLALYNSLK